MLRQSFERAAVFRVVGVNRIVVDARANEIVVTRIIQIAALKSRGRLLIDPERFYPGVPDVARVRRASHAAYASRHAATIAGSQELPLLQREVRELIDPDEQKLRTLILIDVILIPAVSEARRRTVFPGYQML